MSELIRCVVVGSRDFYDEGFVRDAMLRVWADKTERGSRDVLFQFVFPSEVGRDGVNRAVRGVSRAGFNVLHRARQLKKSPASILLPVLFPIDYDRVEVREEVHPTLGYHIDERRVPASDIWVREVFDADVWSEWVLSQSSGASPDFLKAPGIVITVEADGVDGFSQRVSSRASQVGAELHEFKTRSRVVGASR